MKTSRSQNFRASKNPPIDLTSTLGYVKEKISKPGACSLNRFALELFFEFQRGDAINLFFTADDLENAYSAIFSASQTENLKDLSKILDQCFIYVFTDILVGDGEERAHAFLESKKSTVSKELQENIIPNLFSIPPDQIDSVPDVLESNMRAPPKTFQPQFYFELSNFAEQNSKNPCLIFLLRKYFHNLVPVDEILHVTNIGRNRPLREIVNDDRERPFLDEYKGQTNASQDSSQSSSRKHNSNKQGQPSLSQITAPYYANICVSDYLSNTIIYSVERELFIMDMQNEAKKIFDSDEEISALAISPGSKYILVGDVSGNVYQLKEKEDSDIIQKPHQSENEEEEVDERKQMEEIRNRKSEQYGYVITKFMNCRSLITCIAFTPQLFSQFAVGTLNGSVYVFDSSQKTPLRLFALHRTGITSIVIHPNGEYIASSSVDGSVRIWSVTLAACVRIFNFTLKKPVSLRFSHNGQLLLVVCSKGSLYLLEIGTAKQLRYTSIEAQLVDADFSMNDTHIAITDTTGGFSLWSIEKISGTGDPHVSLTVDNITPCHVNYVGLNEIRITGFQRYSK